MQKCIYCGGDLYKLKDGRVLCKSCKQKISVRRTQRILNIIDQFCYAKTAIQCSVDLNLNYTTVLSYYKDLRSMIINYLENTYEEYKNITFEYDEYVYCNKNKKNDKTAIFDAHDFLTFNHGDYIYNLLLPPLNRFRSTLTHNELDNAHYKEFVRFLNLHRISKLQQNNSKIIQFWRFFDDFISSFHGVQSKNFIYYLKEAEFFFNIQDIKKRKEILQQLWFHP